MNRCVATLCLILFCLVAPSARATTVCAASATAIQSALTVAQNNGVDDTIRIVSGSYNLPAQLIFASSEAHALTLSGGWNTGCSAYTGAQTTLEGQNAVALLDLTNNAGETHVQHLTFAGGYTTQSLAAPIEIASNGSDVYVDLNTFIGNHGDGGIGGLEAYSGTGHVYVRNNLVIGNHGALLGGLFVVQDAGEGYVTGNTIVANISDGAQTSGGLGVGGNGHFNISNNIIWNNAGSTGYDFNANAANSRYNNDIGVVGSGVSGSPVVAERYDDPQFAPCQGVFCLSFELAPRSPLVDAGVDTPLGGQVGVDLAGKPRRLGAHVDIGAYENEIIFADGFQ